MRLFPILLSLLLAQVSSPALDVTTVSIGRPATVAELDLGKLKGDLRRLSWSPDGSELCVVTAERETLSHAYLVSVATGAVSPADAEPAWASAYWVVKSDRYAPGRPSIEIAVEQKTENVKSGTGPAGSAEREGTAQPGVTGANDLARAAASQERARIVRLSVFGATIAEFVNTRPLPGLTFGWGPDGSAAIAYVDAQGRLSLLDRARHARAVPGVKDALLPAWTRDGARLAYLQKTGRRKYALMVVALTPQ